MFKFFLKVVVGLLKQDGHLNFYLADPPLKKLEYFTHLVTRCNRHE